MLFRAFGCLVYQNILMDSHDTKINLKSDLLYQQSVGLIRAMA
jgi:hypothetical protein